MPVGLDFGGNPVSLGELQAGVEDHSASFGALFDVEHDFEGKHTKPLQELRVDGLTQLLGGTALGALFALEEGYSYVLGGLTNDLAQLDGAPIEDAVIRLQAGGAYTLTGIVPATLTRRQVHILENGGSNAITLAHNTTSTYRFSLPGETDFDLQSGACVLIQWDVSSEVWRMVVGSGSMVRSVQRVEVTWGSSATTATAAITAVTDLAKTAYTLLGERHVVSAGAPTIQNLAQIDLLNCTTSVVALRRASGSDGGAGAITSTTTVVQIVEYA